MEERITQVLRTGRLTRAFRQGFRLWATYAEANSPRNTSTDCSSFIKLVTEAYIDMYEYGRKTNDEPEMRRVLTQAWKAYAAKQVKDQLGKNKVPISTDEEFLRYHETFTKCNFKLC